MVGTKKRKCRRELLETTLFLNRAGGSFKSEPELASQKASSKLLYTSICFIRTLLHLSSEN